MLYPRAAALLKVILDCEFFITQCSSITGFHLMTDSEIFDLFDNGYLRWQGCDDDPPSPVGITVPVYA